MSIIHMDTDIVEEMTSKMLSSIDNLFEQFNAICEVKASLAFNWQSPTTVIFLDQLTGIINQFESLFNETLELSARCKNERKQWMLADKHFVNGDVLSYTSAKTRAEDGSLFVKGKNDASDIQYDDIKQGATGDCYMLASLSAIAGTNPETIRDMVRDNGDGTYTVFFYENGERVEITVDNVIPQGDDVLCLEGEHLGAYPKDKEELWPLIVEKAYAEWKGGYDAIKTSWSSHAFNDLLGKPATEFYWAQPPSPQEQQARLQELSIALESNAPVTVAMREGFQGNSSGHAYSLQAIEGNQVHLYNPHGYDMTISLDEFYENCYTAAYVAP